LRRICASFICQKENDCFPRRIQFRFLQAKLNLSETKRCLAQGYVRFHRFNLFSQILGAILTTIKNFTVERFAAHFVRVADCLNVIPTNAIFHIGKANRPLLRMMQ